jgi:hypothetical protein
MFFPENKDFILNKILSIGITSLILYSVSWLDSEQGQWIVLTLLIVVLGQGHFVSTYIYHFKSLPQKFSRRKEWIIYFSFLIITAFIFGLLRWEYRLDAFIMGFVGLYFLFHHVLNERTLASYYSGSPTKYYQETFLFFALVTLVFLPTLNNESFSFILSKDVIYLDNASLQSTFPKLQIVSPQIQTAYSFLALVLFFLYCLKGFKKNDNKIKLMGSLTALSFALTYFKIFEDFLYFLAFVILYHYVTWFLFFLFRFSKEDRSTNRNKEYRYSNILIYSSLLALFIFGQNTQSDLLRDLYYFVFSLNFFMFWTFLHITVTLINEKPIERFLKDL